MKKPGSLDSRSLLHRQLLPREVPIAVRLGVLLGGMMALVGWIVFGVGAVFVWAIAANADLASILHFRGELETARGKVVQVSQTSFRTGGSRHRQGTAIQAYAYTFLTPNETEYRGVSYAKGRALSAGQEVTVEYPRGRPEISRIRNMRSAPFGPAAILAAAPAGVGLLLILFGLKTGRRRNWLLAHGRLARGILASKEPTGAAVNKRPVYKLTFEFQAPDGRTCQAIARTHNTEKLTDEAEEPFLYDPHDPARATMVDDLPVHVEFDDNGRITRYSGAIRPLVVPMLIISIYAIVAYLVFVHFR